jgi:hypothetical protein
MSKETSNITFLLGKLSEVMSKIASSDDGEILKLLPPGEAENINKALAALTKYTDAIEKTTQETAELVAAKKKQAEVEAEIRREEEKRNKKQASAEATAKEIEKTA